MSNYSTTNAIPKMTSYTVSSGIVSASSESNKTTRPAWLAFDHADNTGGWASLTKIDWLAYEFSEPIIIGEYSIDSGTISAYYVPKTWTFEGSNDGTNWDILDTRISETSWTEQEIRYYEITNPASYKKYRINITDTNGGSYIYLAELSMFELLSTIKYLIKDINSTLYTYDGTNIIESPSQTLDIDNFNTNGFNNTTVILEEQWNSKFPEKTGLQLLMYTDDTTKTETTITYNVSEYRPVDKLSNQFQIKKYIPNG